MQHKHYDTTALIALPRVGEGSTQERGLLSWTRPYLFERIRHEGVDVAVIRGGHSIDPENSIAHDVIRPKYDKDLQNVKIHKLGNKALNDFGMMRSIVANPDVDHILPVLNPSQLRRLAKDKFQASNILLSPAGAYERDASYLSSAVDNIDDVLDQIRGEHVVAKPNNGLRSKGVIVGDKRSVRNQLIDTNAINYLIEQRMDFSPIWPKIRGENSLEQARLDEANQKKVNKEVRLFAFGEGQWSVVGRVAQPGESDFRDDKWLYLDQDSIPEDLFKVSNAILANIKEVVGTDDVNIAVDFVYTTTETDSDPKWRVMEVNAAEPQLVWITQHETIGKEQHGMLARQIARIANKRKV